MQRLNGSNHSLKASHGWQRYASIHAPYQQAPQSLTSGEPDLSGVPCGNNTTLADIHQLSNQMVEAMDTEIGCLLVDGIVNQQDINNWTVFLKSGSTGSTIPTSSSWCDFPMTNGSYDPDGVYDGFTGMDDLKVIQGNLGRTCPPR